MTTTQTDTTTDYPLSALMDLWRHGWTINPYSVSYPVALGDFAIYPFEDKYNLLFINHAGVVMNMGYWDTPIKAMHVAKENMEALSTM